MLRSSKTAPWVTTGCAALSAIILYAVAVPAIAQAPNCASMADDKARLACYDRGAKPKEKPQTVLPQTTTAPKPATATVPYETLEYRARLERVFLQSGMSADVFVEAAKSGKAGSDFRRYPELIIWTYLTKAMVFKLITESKLLDGAKEAGFKMVDFWDKGNEGHWFYDLTQSGSCDVNKRLCY